MGPIHGRGQRATATRIIDEMTPQRFDMSERLLIGRRDRDASRV
jgi:hypothetical protein